MRDSKSQNSMIKAVLFDMDNTLHHLDASVLAAADAVFCYCKEEFAASLSLLSRTAAEREDAVQGHCRYAREKGTNEKL